MKEKLLQKLEAYCPTACAMHMPGHKRNVQAAYYLKRLSADIDITEIDGFDNLHSPEGIIKDSMSRASKVFGSKQTYYLVGGTTCGILAAIFACTNWNDKVIISRNCHKSVYNAVALRQLQPVYILPEVLQGGISGEITPALVKRAFKENPDAKAMVITSPTYEGVVSDIMAISEIAHSFGAVVIVDQAHGAHFGFGYDFPDSAVNNGADIVIQSLHKTLLSLTQTALLHVCSDRINCTWVQNQLSVFQTSSPSYLLLASIDGCIHELEENLDRYFITWRDCLDMFYNGCGELKNLKLFDYPGRDRSKIVILTNNAGITGVDLMEKLRNEYNVELEMASVNYALAMTGMGDTKESLNTLCKALLQIDKQIEKSEAVMDKLTAVTVPEMALLPWQTQQIEGEYVDLSQAKGRVSLEYVWAYPPGIPVLVPGEIINQDVIRLVFQYVSGGIEMKSNSGFLPEKIFVLKM